MPLPEFKLREAWRGSSAGCEIPKFVIDGGRGGRFGEHPPPPSSLHSFYSDHANMSF